MASIERPQRAESDANRHQRSNLYPIGVGMAIGTMMWVVFWALRWFGVV